MTERNYMLSGPSDKGDTHTDLLLTPHDPDKDYTAAMQKAVYFMTIPRSMLEPPEVEVFLAFIAGMLSCAASEEGVPVEAIVKQVPNETH